MIYDISQSLFECRVYPGDDRPVRIETMRMERGDLYNLTSFSMCAHNGTHIDAPFHFLKDGKTVDEISLSRFVGPAYVCSHSGDVTSEDAGRMLSEAEAFGNGAEKKILIKGNATVTLEAAEVFAGAGIDLLGNESQTVGPEDAPMAVHLALLGADVVILEGINLSGVSDGVYILNCAPLNLTGCEGAPCRAILTEYKGY